MPIKKLRRITDLTVVSAEDEMRRAYGVGELVKLMSDKPVPGKSYHIITGGAIDLICHLYWLLRHWPHMKKVLISAWAISGRDILFLEKLLKDGQIDRVELLVGDIFPTKYKMEWKKLMEIYDSGGISAVYKSTIHSKLLLMEADDGTKLVIESSANCNMNPRVEQSCVTVSEKLYDFYFTYLHEMFDEEQARRTVRETIKLPFDEYISDSERIAEVGENDLGEEMGE
ncbi:MAG: hypothetical protein MR787_04320 [Bacteroidales bacterium]|nr:hypothetical protein [Bacteroidales bacterium]